MKKSVHLRTSKIGNFSVFNLFNNGDEVIIALPHRVSITLHRTKTEIHIDCDLGMISSSIDFCQIAKIGISKLSESDYQSTLVLNDEFKKRVRSFEESFFPEKFIRERKRSELEIAKFISRQRLISPRLISPTRVFGDQWIDQVYIHLAEPAIEQIANIEFGIFRSDTIDDEPLTEPALTLFSSIQLMGELAHYWLFIEWSGSEHWVYEKNFFYNDKVFPSIDLIKKKIKT